MIGCFGDFGIVGKTILFDWKMLPLWRILRREVVFNLTLVWVLRRILCKRYSTNVKNGAVFCACAGLNSLGYRSPVQALQYARPQGVNAARACREAYSLGIR